ncbi:MAG: phytanoyl-CoA dioxygenase family protein [Actinomycetota bacterium]
MDHRVRSHDGFWTVSDVDLDDLLRVVDVDTDESPYEHAIGVESGVIVYDAAAVEEIVDDLDRRRRVLGEIAHAIGAGPGVVAFRGAVDPDAVHRSSAVCDTILRREREAGISAADHFAVAGANERAWNTLEKLALDDPGTFVDYYASETIALASEAWLGPGYQVTAQINVVNPGGAAQAPHRDYHLGFMTDDEVARFPHHVHTMSPMLTLQGAVAHCEMPIESGPTKLLPHSQKYPLGYLAYRQPEVAAAFEERFVQLPLDVGDAVFFNPALLHAAGDNRSADVRRVANLLQVSSPLGRAMERVDRTAVVRAIYPALRRRRDAGWSERAVGAALGAAAEGYAFPSDLDNDPPVDGLAPATQADIVRRALDEGWTNAQLDEALTALDRRRRVV